MKREKAVINSRLVSRNNGDYGLPADARFEELELIKGESPPRQFSTPGKFTKKFAKWWASLRFDFVRIK